MTQPSDDSRNRPVVLQTRAEPAARHMRKPVRVLAGATLVVAALSGAAGLAFGGSAVWSVVGPQAGNDAPQPLWIAPPSPVTKVPVPAQVDDHRTTTTENRPTTDNRGRGGGGEAEPNDPDRPTTAGKAATHTQQAPATSADRRRGAGGSGGGGGGSGGGGSSSGGGGSSAHGGGDG